MFDLHHQVQNTSPRDAVSKKTLRELCVKKIRDAEIWNYLFSS
jgi:hypothetical protein